VKRKIAILEFEKHESVRYYTIKLAEENNTEIQRFFDKYDTQEFKADFDVITSWVNIIGEKGASKEFFRPEGGKVKAIPIDSNKLRLYCFRVNESIVIFGNGGLKKTETYQEDPELNDYAETLREIGEQLLERVSKNEAQFKGGKIFGKLIFTIETRN
jgi:hypothetical protein